MWLTRRGRHGLTRPPRASPSTSRRRNSVAAADSGQTCNFLYLARFAPFSIKSSPKCYKSQEEEVYTFLELQIPRKLVGKILSKPATFEPRDPDVQKLQTRYSEPPWDLSKLAVSLDCPKT